MSHQDAKRTSDADSPSRRLTRRSLLQGAATAGAAGLAVTVMGAAASPALAATSRSSAPEQSASAQSQDHHEHAGPIMVHVRDARTGDIEVFSGTSQTQLRDKDLAARIARALA
jgi:nitrous oxide reductase